MGKTNVFVGQLKGSLMIKCEKKKSGFSILELIISISLLGMILSMSFISFNSESISFESNVYLFKSALRRYMVDSYYSKDKFSLEMKKNNIYVYQKNDIVDSISLEKNTYILGSDRSISYRNMNRFGSPEKGQTFYLFNVKSKRLERITVMIGSGRIYSYNENYLDNKDMIDYYVKGSE